MKPKCFDDSTDLRHINARQVLVISRAMSGKTNAEVAEDMDLGEETVARYQRDPQPGESPYELPIGRVQAWNRATGNDLVMRWLAQRCGGVFAQERKTKAPDAQIADIVNVLNRETSDVIQQMLMSLRDGKWTLEEVKKLMKELRDVMEQSHGALMAAERLMEESGRRP
jgi:hypothetical protein